MLRKTLYLKEEMVVDPKLKVMIAKLLPSRHLDAFLDGNLHMNNAAYFRTLEGDGGLRSDSDEGIEWARQVTSLSLQDEDGAWIPIGGLINPVKYWTDESVDFNMFCMYMFSDQPDDVFDDRNLAFGDTYVLITNLPEFIRRVREAAIKLGRGLGHGPVEYVSHVSHDGPMGPFRKFAHYSHQKEFRIALKGGGGAATTLKIGDIRDICGHGPLSELGDLIRWLKPKGGL